MALARSSNWGCLAGTATRTFAVFGTLMSPKDTVFKENEGCPANVALSVLTVQTAFQAAPAIKELQDPAASSDPKVAPDFAVLQAIIRSPESA
uniref:Secreted protein n=1 Tax=Bursaphelenchus xylophilus TaxID=6326 RepID=A0A1I7SBB0_BURXY